MPNRPRKPFSIWPYVGGLGLALMVTGATGLLIRQMSWLHGLTFLAGIGTAIALALTIFRPFVLKMAERRFPGMAGGSDESAWHDVGDDDFAFDPDSFEETRRQREERERQERIAREKARAKERERTEQAKADNAKSPEEKKLDERIAQLRDLMDHPRTPEHERAAAAQAYAKLLTKRSKLRGEI